MSGHKAQSESIAESVGEWMGQEGMTDATMISSSIDALRHAVLAATEAADAQVAATRAQTLVLERMERNGQTRTVGL